MQDEIPTEQIFAAFRELRVAAPHGDRRKATRSLSDCAVTPIRSEGSQNSIPQALRGSFYARVVEALELGATIPLLLWLISGNHTSGRRSRSRAGCRRELGVRRTLLRATMKDVNRFVVALIKHLDTLPDDQVGEVTAAFLLDQTADSRAWPTDDQLAEACPRAGCTGTSGRTVCARAQRRRAERRSARNEDVTLPVNLQIEHVMPQKWHTHWSDGIAKIPTRRRTEIAWCRPSATSHC